MTMPKREVNTIWSKVRDDRDIDDLIFNYEACHTSEDDTCSDRCRPFVSSGTLMRKRRMLRPFGRGILSFWRVFSLEFSPSLPNVYQIVASRPWGTAGWRNWKFLVGLPNVYQRALFYVQTAHFGRFSAVFRNFVTHASVVTPP